MTVKSFQEADRAGLTMSRHARRGGLKSGLSRTGMLMLLPTLAAFSLVILYPFVKSLALSLFESTMMSPKPAYTGLDNFRRLLSDPNTWEAVVVTAVYVVGCTGGTILLGLGWALIVNQPFRGRGALRSLSLIPWLLPSTVTAFLWAWVFNSRYGILNALLMELGLIELPVPWLSTPGGAMTAVVLTKIWLSIPLFMSFFLAGLQSVDREQLEAANVDGATNWHLLKDHILPHLRPVLLVVVIIGMIGNLQSFDTIFALTKGGPVRATSVLSVSVYRYAFEEWDIGMAASVGVLWVATILPPAYFYLRRLLKGE